ncbi:altered inheritance of mitochondria protein 32-like [Bidens hawaiensis]|uniref:altered inheritance of mitochondria protein 32-like n=1 Tax=Bidens hawaiensis TaxID=980011 RepID=UPI00404B3E1D
MAAVPDNGTTTVTTAVPDNDKFGFKRPDMYAEKLTGTAIAYDRHVILCYKTHELWPSRVESSDAHPLPKVLAGALKAHLLTICEGRDGTELSDGDVLLFPEMIKYRGLKEPDINSFVDEVIVNRKLWSAGVQETMMGTHVFVCAHSSRDKRCGFCGPILISKFKEEIELRGLDKVSVTACSHVGGHKYAGNLIICNVRDNKVCGHWYGYVTPSDVPELLDNHIGKGEIIDRIWRGQMGVSSAKKSQNKSEPSTPNGNDLKMIDQVQVEDWDRDQQASRTVEEKENNGGCCQGANGFSCCRYERDKTETETETETEKGNKIMTKFDIFTRKWEKHEVFTAAAVVGAVVSVALAYSFFKRLR